MPRWTQWFPVLGVVTLLAATFWTVGPALAALCVMVLVGAVLASVHHAEVVARRVGEPFGTVILAVAITVIEVALVISLMISGGADAASLPRDTVFSAIMIICTGVVGLCLVIGGLRHHEQAFRIEGASSAFACLIALASLSLVLPGFTTSAPGLMYSGAQLIFAGVASLVLWLVFVFVQTVRHRDYFLQVGESETEREAGSGGKDGRHEGWGGSHDKPPPSRKLAWISFGFLLLSLAAVIGLAKSLAPIIEQAVNAVGASHTLIGIGIAFLVLMPETWAAVRAALANRLQISLNLALGSALASIGLTIPAVALASIWLKMPLVLGLGSKDIVLMVLSFMVGSFTLATGRTTVLQGAVHLVLFAAFVFLAFVP